MTKEGAVDLEEQGLERQSSAYTEALFFFSVNTVIFFYDFLKNVFSGLLYCTDTVDNTYNITK